MQTGLRSAFKGVPFVWRMLVLLVSLAAGARCQRDCKFYSYIPPDGGSYGIRNPQHPDRYGPSSTCYWYYYTDPGSRLSLDCYSVEMGNSVPWDCTDKLSVVGTVYDDYKDFCTPFNVESSSTRIVLTLKTSPRSNGGSFACAIRAIKAEACDCGWTPKRRFQLNKEEKCLLGDIRACKTLSIPAVIKKFKDSENGIITKIVLDPDIITRIVGGRETGINEFPLMVSILDIRRRAHFCGGAIISENFVLTAAHCLQQLDVRLTGLLVGEHDLRTGSETNVTKLYRASQFIIHPGYSRNTQWHDIGLIRSGNPIKFNSRVGPVCLPFNRPFMPSIDEYLTAIGWGTISFGGPMSDVLLKAKIRVVPEDRCRMVFNQSAASGKQVCTFTPGKDTCQMDSGGPLITSDYRTARFFLAALVSFGPSDCGGHEPAVNTRIASYLDWIQEKTGDKFCVK